MPSPFPGMDPYLEEPGVWPTFRAALNDAIRAELSLRLPTGFVAGLDSYYWARQLEAAFDEPGPTVRDAFPFKVEDGGAVSFAAPYMVTLPPVVREIRSFIKIEDSRRNRVVTIVEVLTPAAKERGQPGRLKYLTKRYERPRQGVSFVEIDLLRSGLRVPLDPGISVVDYYAAVARHWEAPLADIWSFGVRDPLPEIPIPLTENEPPVPVSLRACLDRAWADARYEEDLNYRRPPEPPLSEPDAAWAAQLLNSAGRG